LTIGKGEEVFYAVLFLFLLILGLYPVIRACYLRLAFRMRLKKVCKIRKYRILRISKTKTKANTPDLIIDTGDCIFALRIKTAWQKYSMLVCHSDHSMVIRRKFPTVFQKADKQSFYIRETRKVQVPAILLPTSLCEEKTVHLIFLLNPVCKSVLYEDDHGMQNIRNGDAVWNMRLLSAAALLRILQDPFSNNSK